MARVVPVVAGAWRPRGAFLALALSGLVPGAALAGSACPVNQLTLNGVATESTAPTFSANGTNAAGSYDLRAGSLGSSVTSSDQISGSGVDTDDEYVLVGIPPGTPIDFSAVFTVAGSWSVYPGVPQGDRAIDAKVWSDEASAEWPSPFGGWCCHSSVSQTLSIPLHHGANEPFHVRTHLESQQYRGTVTVNGGLTFAGLPPGAGIVSCQGFASNPPVSVGDAMFSSLRLSAVRPNPARAGVSATVSLPATSAARLEVIDLQGRIRLLRNLEFATAGTHEVRLDAARALEPGSYFLRLAQAGRSAIRSFSVVR
jgi:hypothetical protein